MTISTSPMEHAFAESVGRGGDDGGAARDEVARKCRLRQRNFDFRFHNFRTTAPGAFVSTRDLSQSNHYQTPHLWPRSPKRTLAQSTAAFGTDSIALRPAVNDSSRQATSPDVSVVRRLTMGAGSPLYPSGTRREAMATAIVQLCSPTHKSPTRSVDRYSAPPC
jgi:hypothetical protein